MARFVSAIAALEQAIAIMLIFSPMQLFPWAKTCPAFAWVADLRTLSFAACSCRIAPLLTRTCSTGCYGLATLFGVSLDRGRQWAQNRMVEQQKGFHRRPYDGATTPDRIYSPKTLLGLCRRMRQPPKTEWQRIVRTDMNIDQNNVPEGMSFLRLIWEQEDACEEETDKYISRIDGKLPLCLENIGTVLSFLDRMASCYWECRGGDHMVEYLCGKVTSAARAALRLTRFGFYDEALLACRTIGETTNLFHLFCADASAMEEWKTSSKAERRKKFSPVEVRKRLEASAGYLIIDEKRYRLLCEKSAHVNPTTKPQSYNLLGVPSAGANLQEEGLFVCVNEIALSLAFATLFSVGLLGYKGDVREQIFSSVSDLAEKIGNIGITSIEDYNRQVWLKNRKELSAACDVLRYQQRARRDSVNLQNRSH